MADPTDLESLVDDFADTPKPALETTLDRMDTDQFRKFVDVVNRSYAKRAESMIRPGDLNDADFHALLNRHT